MTAAVLVHGTTAGPETFDAQRALAERLDLVFFARRGYGERSGLAGPPGSNFELGWPLDVPDLVQLIEERGGGHLVGHSYGGAVAAAAASQRPDLVRSLILVETALGPVAATDPEMHAVLERERELYAQRLSMDARSFAAGWMAASLGTSAEAARGWIDTWDSRLLRAADITRREAWWATAPVELEVLAGLACPKVVVMGARRPPYGPDTQARTARLATATAERIGGRLLEFERSTHFPPSEEPEAFNALLLELASA